MAQPGAEHLDLLEKDHGKSGPNSQNDGPRNLYTTVGGRTGIHMADRSGGCSLEQTSMEGLVKGESARTEPQPGTASGGPSARNEKERESAEIRKWKRNATQDSGTENMELKTSAGEGHRSPAGIACIQAKHEHRRLVLGSVTPPQFQENKKRWGTCWPSQKEPAHLRHAVSITCNVAGDETKNSTLQEMHGST